MLRFKKESKQHDSRRTGKPSFESWLLVFGEMDRNKWWNTKGLLSSIGEMAISRGLPKTHVFARCRSAFAVASARSDEVFNPPNSFTLWRLPVEIEDKIEDEWATWIGNPEPWDKFIKEVDGQSKGAVADVIAQLGLASEVTLESLPTFKRASDFRSVPIKAGESVSVRGGRATCPCTHIKRTREARRSVR